MRRPIHSAVCILSWFAVAACAEPDAADAVIETRTRGVAHREALLRTVECEFIMSVYLADAARELRSPPRGLPLGHTPEWFGLEQMPQGGQTWMRLFARENQLRVESILLCPGPNPTDLPWCVLSGRSYLRDAAGAERQADYVRGLMVWDGTYRITYDTVRNFWVSRQADWHGGPATHPLVRSALSLGTTAAQFSQLLRPPAVTSDTTVSISRDPEHPEIRCVSIVLSYGITTLRRRFCVAPDLGYAVTSWEHRVDAVIDGERHGSGELHQARDFRQVADGIWLPHYSIHQTYVYKPDEPALRRTEVVEVREAHANRDLDDTLFRPLPPLGAIIVEFPRGGPAQRESGYAVEWAESRARDFATDRPPGVNPQLNDSATDPAVPAGTDQGQNGNALRLPAGNAPASAEGG